VGLGLGYVDVYLFASGTLSLAPTYVLLRVLGCWAAFTLLECLLSRQTAAAVWALYTHHIGVLTALLALIVCAVAFAMLPDAYWNDGPMYLLYPAYDSLVLLLSMLLPLRAHHRRHFRTYLLCALLVLLSSILFDAAYPGTFSIVPDRAAGFALNPNTAAFVLVLLCACIIDLHQFRSRDTAVLTLTAIGVFITLSRAGGILLACTFGCYVYRMMRVSVHSSGTVFVRGLQLAAPFIVLYATAAALVERADIFALSFQPRLAMLRGMDDIVTADDDRVHALSEALRALSRSPVVGYGTGYSYSMSATPHNIYLQQWINNGLPGLAAYLLLLLVSARLFWRRRSARGLLFIGLVTLNGFFSHNILEERAVLCLLGILLTCSLLEPWPGVRRRHDLTLT
jgi:O-antigen ligase